MASFVETINRVFEKRKYDIIFHDRRQLTDAELEQWIPEIKLKLGAIKKYFNEVIDLCEIQKNSPVFNQAVQAVINPLAMTAAEGSPKETPAAKFFNDIKNNAKSQGVDDVDKILGKFKDIKDIKHLRQFFNEVNMFCLSITTVNNKLLLYKIQAYPFLINEQTNQTLATAPVQYSITIEPFQILVANIVAVAQSASDSISEWVKYQQKVKAQYWELNISRLNVRNAQLALFINFSTVLLAVGLSAVFLFASDPFNLFKDNQKLKQANMELRQENIQLRQLKTMPVSDIGLRK